MKAFCGEALKGLESGGRRVSVISFVLTYHYPHAYRSEHVSKLVDNYAARLNRKRLPYAYAWTLEVKGDRIHLHLLFFVPYRTQLPHPNRKPVRGRMPWSHGWAGLKRARCIPATVSYITKCESKHNLPRHSRMFGLGGVDRAWKAVASWHALPKWVKEKTAVGEALKPAPGGGYYAVETGEIYKSPWKYSCIREGCEWKRYFTYVGDGHP